MSELRDVIEHELKTNIKGRESVRGYCRYISRVVNESGYNTNDTYVRKIYYQLDDNEKIRGHDNLKSVQGIPHHNTKYYWDKSNPNISAFVKVEAPEIDWQKLITNAINETNLVKPTPPRSKHYEPKALNAIISDAHVGMDCLPKESLFGFKYDKTIFRKHLDVFFNDCVMLHDRHGRFEVLYLDDLGDGLDGAEKRTTRGTHELPQNMLTADAFEVFFQEKLRLVKLLFESDIADKIVLRNVTNDNHAGWYGRMANRALAEVLKVLYPERVDCYNIDTFIGRFHYGDHCDLLTHGKDEKFMKCGLPLKLNDKAINFIEKYITVNNIDSKFIHVKKGDLHQFGYEAQYRFDYLNCPSFAPPSAWVQANFAGASAGYTMQVYPKFSNDIDEHRKRFTLERIEQTALSVV